MNLVYYHRAPVKEETFALHLACSATIIVTARASFSAGKGVRAEWAGWRPCCAACTSTRAAMMQYERNQKSVETAKTEGRGIQSIEVGNRLLLALMRSGAPMMLRDLAAEAEIGAAQAHAYLASFRRTEMVEQEASGGRYILGPATNRLAMARMASFEPLAIVNERAPELARSLGVLVALVVWGPQAPTTYQVHDSGQGLNINLRPGTIFSVMNSASGRVFGAFDPSAAVEQRIQDEIAGSVARAAGGAKSTKAEFERSLASVRRHGYALLADSPVPGLTSIAAPVMSAQRVILVVTLTGATALMKATDPDSPREVLLRFAAGITDEPA